MVVGRIGSGSELQCACQQGNRFSVPRSAEPGFAQQLMDQSVFGMGTQVLTQQKFGLGHVAATEPRRRALQGRIHGGCLQGLRLRSACRTRITRGHQMPCQLLPGRGVVGFVCYRLLPLRQSHLTGAWWDGGLTACVFRVRSFQI